MHKIQGIYFPPKDIQMSPKQCFPLLSQWWDQCRSTSAFTNTGITRAISSPSGINPRLPRASKTTPLTRNPQLPSIFLGASEVGVVLCLGRGRRVRFDVLGAEERKPLVTTESTVWKLKVA